MYLLSAQLSAYRIQVITEDVYGDDRVTGDR